MRSAANRLADLAGGETLAMIPSGSRAERSQCDIPPCKRGGCRSRAGSVQAAWKAVSSAYLADQPIDLRSRSLRPRSQTLGTHTPADARSVQLEVFYDRHDPWMKTAIFYGLAIVLFGVSRLVLTKPLTAFALACTAVGIGEHLLGVGLRVAILNRAPRKQHV